MAESSELEPQAHESSLAHRIAPPASTGALGEPGPVSWSPKRGGGLMILGAGVVLLLAVFFDIYPIEIAAEHASWRDNGYAIVLLAAGVVLALMGRSVIATGAALLVGLLMVVLAVVLDYPLTLRIMDFLLGVLVLAGSVMSLSTSAEDQASRS